MDYSSSQTLNNGILVDPHDHKALSDAMLKLVADKNMWLDCRKNGLKNIHRFSWPEHCKNYLAHVEHCRMRHPATSLDVAPHVEEPMSDSLKDVNDLSIRFSVDGGDIKANGDHVGTLLEVLQQHHAKQTNNLDGHHADYCPGRRKRVFVIAADCYDADGRWMISELGTIIDKVMALGGGHGGQVGFVFSTGSTVAETVEAMGCCQVEPRIFDALICMSGSEIYYPWREMMVDVDYGAHVGYRWPAEHIKSAVPRICKVDDGVEEDDLVIDEVASGGLCYSYSLRVGAKARKVDDIRRRLRMRGFRCNVVYTRASTRLNVVPLFASRALALRYLFTRWGTDPSKMVVFVGERGDADHEELLPGIHKTLIIGGLVSFGSEERLRDEDNYKKEDMVPSDSPNIVSLSKGDDTVEISSIAELI